MKGFLFGALLLNMMAAYIAYNDRKKKASVRHSIFLFASISSFIMIVIFSIDLTVNKMPFLMSYKLIVVLLVLYSLSIFIYSIVLKEIAGQLIAASIFLFLVLPTIFTYGFYFLIVTIVLLAIALFTFYNERKQSL